MLHQLKTYTHKEINAFIKSDEKEVRLGEKIQFVNDYTLLYDQIKKSNATHVLLGISKNNTSKDTSYPIWESTLKSLLNTNYNHGTENIQLLLLGYLDVNTPVDLAIQTPKNNVVKKQYESSSKIEKEITYLIQLIIKSKKTPIIIGENHHNSYGILKGVALRKNKAINVINISNTAGLKKIEKRFHKNNTTDAIREGFLKKYFIYGLYEHYISKKELAFINTIPKQIKHYSYEFLKIKNNRKKKEILDNNKNFTANGYFGLELNCAAISKISSKKLRPFGFSIGKTLKLIHFFGAHKNNSYLYIYNTSACSTKKKKIEVIGTTITHFILGYLK